MLALIDESVRFGRGSGHYVVAAAALVEEPGIARETLRSCLFEDSSRVRPFHWATEGTRVREAMLRCVIDLNITVHAGIHHPTDERGQERARELLLTGVLLPQLIDAGVTELLIESRDHRADRTVGPQDARDLRTIRNYLRPWRGCPTFDWTNKTEPLLWIADAVAGVVREHADGSDGRWLRQLAEAGVPAYLTWLDAEALARRMRKPRLPS